MDLDEIALGGMWRVGAFPRSVHSDIRIVFNTRRLKSSAYNIVTIKDL
jgi:hypothetical protein